MVHFNLDGRWPYVTVSCVVRMTDPDDQGLDSSSGTEDHFLCYVEVASNSREDVCKIT